jgi:hypothetical protein
MAAEKTIKYRGHTIRVIDVSDSMAMLCPVWYSGAKANGGTSSVARAKREIDRRLLQPTCKHAKTRPVKSSLAPDRNKPFALQCERCDKWVGWSA